MITMEFDDMKKIWDAQQNEFFFGINEQALHNRIRSKKRQGIYISNASELLGIFTNMAMGLGIIAINVMKKNNSLLYVLAAWMLMTAAYLLIQRLRRKKAELIFDRTLRSELAHAVSVASYQVRLSALLRWNVVPVGLLVVALMWSSGKSPWISVALVLFLLLASLAGRWEHNIYKNRKRELEILQSKLRNED